MKVKILNKEFGGWGDAWLVAFPKRVSVKDRNEKEICKTRYFGIVMLTDREMLVFPVDKNGKMLSFNQVAGGRGITHEEAIKKLEENYSIGGDII